MSKVTPFSINHEVILGYLNSFFANPENRTSNALISEAEMCRFDSEEVKNAFMEKGKQLLSTFH